MDELIFKALRGETSELEERQLLHWRRASLDHQRRYEELTALWELTRHVEPVGAPPPDVRSIVEAAERRRRWRVLGGPWRRSWFGGLAAAAALTAVLLGGWMLLGPPPTADEPGATTEVAAGATAAVTATLSDGSFVRLAPGSRLQYAEDGRRRRVNLEGRGLFAVAPDPSRPFTVTAGGGEVTVVGTRFELQDRDDLLRLIVVEGHVRFTAAGTTIDVPERHVSYARGGRSPTLTEVKDPYELLEWPEGWLLFQSTPLARAAAEVARFHGRRIAVTDSAAARRTVTAWFAGETYEETVSTLCMVTATRCVLSDTLVTVGS